MRPIDANAVVWEDDGFKPFRVQDPEVAEFRLQFQHAFAEKLGKVLCEEYEWEELTKEEE